MMKKLMALLLLGIFALSMVPINVAAFQTNSNENGGVWNEYKVNKENYSKLKEDSRNLATNWGKAKSAWTGLKVSSESNFRNELSTDSETSLESYKEYLGLTIDRVVNKLKMLGYWVDRVIDDEQVEENYLNIINEEIQKLENLREKVDGAESMDDLKVIAKKIKEIWSDTNSYIKKMVGHILGIKLDDVLDRLEKLSDRLHGKVDALDQNNKLVGEMQDLLNDFDEKLDLANKEYEQFRENYITISSKDSNVLEAREHLRKAHEYLKEAHKILKEFLELYREYQGNVSPEVSSKPLYLEAASAE
ncbi:MAG: hypothetical protein ABIH25_02950 [Candidatus Woesearchaeota archaeon]